MRTPAQPGTVDTVDLSYPHEHAVGARRWHVLAHVGCAQREFAMAAIDEREHLDGGGAAAVDQRVERGANRATCVEHVVDNDHHCTVDTWCRASVSVGECGQRSGGTRPVIAMAGRVEHQDRWCRMAQAGELVGDCACKRYSPCRY